MNHRDAFLHQLQNPYQSTIAFEQFLSKKDCFREGSEVLDIGTGFGGLLHYFKDKHPCLNFHGIDYDEKNIDGANSFLKQKKTEGISFDYGDWFNLPKEYKNRFEGIVSVHTLCCFKKIKKAIEKLTDINPKWVAFKSLFYEGPMDVLIHIRDLESEEIGDDNPDGDFNIFSLNNTAKIFNSLGYDFFYEPFFPNSTLPKKENGERGTYTMKTELSEFTQFSGPVHLPWYFVIGMKA